MFWYGRQDLNLHGNPLEPKSNVSANSTTPAFYKVLCFVLLPGLSGFMSANSPCCGARQLPCRHAAASSADRGHSLRSLTPPPAALPSLPTPAFYKVLCFVLLLGLLGFMSANSPCCGARQLPCRHAAASSADRGHSLRSLTPPPAALPSLPTPAFYKVLCCVILSRKLGNVNL